MSLSNVIFIKRPFPVIASFAATNYTGTANAQASIGHATKSGTIDRVVCWKTSAAASGTLAVRLETMSSGQPTGTLLATGSDGSVAVAGGAATNQLITLNTPVSVTRGDLFACVNYLSAYVATVTIARGIGGTLGISGHSTGIPGIRSNPTFSVGSSANWTSGNDNTISMLCPLFDDGTPALQNCFMVSETPVYTSIPTSGSNSYYGAKWVCDITCDLEGIYDQGRSEDAYYSVYDSGNNLLGTSIAMHGVGTNVSGQAIFATPIRLTTGQTYRIVKRNTSGTNTLLIVPMYSQTMLEYIYGQYCLTTSSDGTGWTDTATSAPCITLAVTPVSGGGLFLPRTMNGGYDG